MNFPTHRSKPLLHLSIPGNIRFELGLPEFNTSLWQVRESAARMSVPEATMNQKNRPTAREYYIRLTRQVAAMKPKPVSHPVKHAPHH